MPPNTSLPLFITSIRHFSEAAKEHELAADAYDAGDQTASELHSFKAYRHQLNAVQYSEIAVMEAFELNEINEI